MDLADFLLARIAEEEALARTAADGFAEGYGGSGAVGPNWHSDGEGKIRVLVGREGTGAFWETEGYYGIAPEIADHIVRWDPASVLAECEAKRGIVLSAQAAADEPEGKVWPPHVHMTGMADGLGMALKYLAVPYASHPDYREEWKL